jgi:hypothetical protein
MTEPSCLILLATWYFGFHLQLVSHFFYAFAHIVVYEAPFANGLWILVGQPTAVLLYYSYWYKGQLDKP